MRVCRFKAADLTNTTDFTIKLGQHQWQIHSRVVSEASQFFRVACTGRFEESTRRQVELHDDSPWEVARLIQFFYLETYDHTLPDKQSLQSMPIMELVSQGDFPSESEKREEEDRQEFQTHTLMWELANKYNCNKLREYIGKKLILKFRLVDFKDHAGRASKYLQVCDLIRGSFHEMPDIEDKMVSILLDMKLRASQRSSRTTFSVLPMRLDQSTANEVLQREMFSWMSEHASFATKIARGLEQLLDLSMQTHDYSGVRIESMKSRTRHVGTRTTRQRV